MLPRPTMCRLLAFATLLCACAVDNRPESVPDGTAATDSVEAAGSTTAVGDAPADSSSSGGPTSTGATGNSDEDSTGDSGSDTGSGMVDWPQVPCVADNDAVWILGLDPSTSRARIDRFDPETASFFSETALTCLDDYALDGPVSLAVARDGVAYVSGLAAEDLLLLDVLADDPCSTLLTEHWTLPFGFASLAFRSNDAFDPDTERLFAHGPWAENGGWFGEVFPFVADNPVAIYSGSNVAHANLTGTGDGQLFGVDFDGEILPLDGKHYSGAGIAGSPDVRGKAFVAWGGAIYVFDEDQEGQGGGPIQIYRFALDGTASYELVAPAPLPIEVVAAATSTCAPTLFGG